MSEIYPVDWAGERWELTGDCALVSPARQVLIVADVHCGKAAALRARGLALPEGDTRADLDRLSALGAQFHTPRLIVAGDFFHAPQGQSCETVAILDDWFSGSGFDQVDLVTGNHDRRIEELAARWGLVLHGQRLVERGVCVVHDPADAPGDVPSICGHWHPAVRVPDGRRTGLRLPCFLVGPRRIVLPSFGTLTGARRVNPDKDERVFGIAEGQVLEIPQGLL